MIRLVAERRPPADELRRIAAEQGAAVKFNASPAAPVGTTGVNAAAAYTGDLHASATDAPARSNGVTAE
jgi:hypothetical protein